MKKVPVLISLPEYTQLEENALAVALVGQAAGLYSMIFNTTLNTERTWDGTAFVNTQTMSPTAVPALGATIGTSLAVTGGITSSGGGIGYNTGAGGIVTQLTSRTTGVILNKLCGNITMFSAAQAANALVTFTLTNSFISPTDYLLIQHIAATNGGAWSFSTVCGVGSATISIRNHTTASITEATPMKFIIIKASLA